MRITRKNPAPEGKSNMGAQQGSTILLVTLMLALMGIIVIFLIYRVDAERLAAVYMEQRVRYQQIAEAVLQKYLGLLVADDTPDLDTQKDDWFAGGRIEYEENGYTITVIMEDEGSKPNINLQNPDSFYFLFPIDRHKEPIPIDSLLDWLDVDDVPREKGAEIAQYQELNPPYKPRDGWLSSIEEIKEMKDSDKYYSYLAPELTVFGKINPNVLDYNMFRMFLISLGFEKLKGKDWVDTACNQFSTLRFSSHFHFNETDDLLKIEKFLIPEKDMLEPFVQFKGSCNPNFVSKGGFKMILRQIAQQMTALNMPGAPNINVDLADMWINNRNDYPFKELGFIFPTEFAGQDFLKVGDYFTLVSTIIHYKIWVVKGTGKYYLDTIQERTPVKGIHDWEVHPLTWKVLTNDEVPEIPKPPTPSPTPG